MKKTEAAEPFTLKDRKGNVWRAIQNLLMPEKLITCLFGKGSWTEKQGIDDSALNPPTGANEPELPTPFYKSVLGFQPGRCFGDTTFFPERLL
jgi:hypothetical protein